MKREELKFEDWGAIWLNYKKEFVKESTYANYLTAMANHIIPAFQGMKIEEISNQVIQKTILMWSKSGRRNQCGGLAVKTIKDMVVILKMCLKDYEEFYELDSKSRTVKYPVQNRSNEIEVWSREQQDFVMRLIRENLGNETLEYAISLCTGIRIGELCALQWNDIDLQNRMIRINKTLQRIYLKTDAGRGISKVIITSPKSEKSIREVPISNILFGLFSEIGEKRGDCYVLTGKDTYIEPRLYRKHYRDFMERYQVKPIKFHALRHTFATRCIENGADYKIVSELLGHASVNLTLNLYVHPNLEDKRRCVDLIC